jgi:hypothetical protein
MSNLSFTLDTMEEVENYIESGELVGILDDITDVEDSVLHGEKLICNISYFDDFDEDEVADYFFEDGNEPTKADIITHILDSALDHDYYEDEDYDDWDEVQDRVYRAIVAKAREKYNLQSLSF